MSDKEKRSIKAFRNFSKALHNLERTMALPSDNEDYRNSAILSFVIAYEQFWKTLKWILKEYIALDINGPKPILQAAYAQGWLGNKDKLWLNMANDRNLVAHTYDEERAREIYEHVKQYAVSMRDCHKKLSELYPDLQP
ncbi:MAG: HI0074 family nucleotidyltransferase substrate-binding subunit [Pseudomonadota bacterium]